jgi:hypothetical protein
MAENITKLQSFVPNRHILGLAISVLVGLGIWFMPPVSGLTVTGQHAMAVVLMTVLLWITEAVPTGVAALLMIGIVLCFIPEVPPQKFLAFWTSDTMWFILVCFIFSAIVEISGLGHRLAVYVFSLRRLFLIDVGVFGGRHEFGLSKDGASSATRGFLRRSVKDVEGKSLSPTSCLHDRRTLHEYWTFDLSGILVQPCAWPDGWF